MQQPHQQQEQQRRRWIAIAWILFFSTLALWFLTGRNHPFAQKIKQFSSPDGNYKLVLYRLPMLLAMPGHSGDADGYVRVYNRHGKTLCKYSVPMVSMVQALDPQELKWSDRAVSLPNFEPCPLSNE